MFNNQRRQFYQDDRIDNFGGRQPDFNRQNHERMNLNRGGRGRGGGPTRNFDRHTGRYNEPLDNFNIGPSFGRMNVSNDFDNRRHSTFDHPPRDMNRRPPPDMRQHDTFGRYPIGIQATDFRNEKRPLPPPPTIPRINQANSNNRMPPTKNSFSKFRSLEEFRDFRRHLKIRKSLEGDVPFQNKSMKNSDSDDFIFIAPNDIRELKSDIYASLCRKLSNPEDEMEEICRVFARFQYHLCYKDYNKAKETSQTKKELPKNDVYYSCMICDCYFIDKNISDIHVKSGMHLQISKIHAESLIIGKKYLTEYLNSSTLSVGCPIAETVGILVSLKDEKVEYSQFDVKGMEQDAFVLAVLEKTLTKYWPQPKSEHFCRCCNYSEFTSKSMLDRHLQSARHLEFYRHYNEAFCIACQHHFGDANQMKVHHETKEHDKISHLMEFTKKQSIEYWKYWHFKDLSLIPKYRPEPSVDHNSDKSVDSSITKESSSQPSEIKSPLKDINVPFLEENPSFKGQLDGLKRSTLNSPVKTEGDALTNTGRISSSSLNESVEPPIKRIALDDKPSIVDDEALTEKIKDPTSLDIDKYKDYVHGNTTVNNEVKEKGEENKKEEKEIPKSDLDEYIVPLTGFMCTVCHETLADMNTAMAHKDTNSHKSKVKTHQILFG